MDLFLVFLFGDVKDFLASVIAALGANAMGADHLAAMRASDEAGDVELEVGPAKPLRGFARASLWNCHDGFLLSEQGDYRRIRVECNQII